VGVIKATSRTSAGQPVLLIGLTGENVTRLYADEPILFSTGELGLPSMLVVIVAGRTDDEIKEAIGRHVPIH
jgi:hypothetical protein